MYSVSLFFSPPYLFLCLCLFVYLFGWLARSLAFFSLITFLQENFFQKGIFLQEVGARVLRIGVSVACIGPSSNTGMPYGASSSPGVTPEYRAISKRGTLHSSRRIWEVGNHFCAKQNSWVSQEQPPASGGGAEV